MEIMKVLGRIVCTQRVAGLGHMNLRILENNKGKKLVAVDAVGCKPGDWVICVGSSAAREAAGSKSYPCLLYTSPSPRDRVRSRMPSSA